MNDLQDEREEFIHRLRIFLPNSFWFGHPERGLYFRSDEEYRNGSWAFNFPKEGPITFRFYSQKNQYKNKYGFHQSSWAPSPMLSLEDFLAHPNVPSEIKKLFIFNLDLFQ